MSDDPRINVLLMMLWRVSDREAGMLVRDLRETLQDEALLTICADDGLIEFIRRNHCTSGPEHSRKLHLEPGWNVAEFNKPNRKSVWQFLEEIFAEDVPEEICHRIRLGKKGAVVAARLELGLSAASQATAESGRPDSEEMRAELVTLPTEAINLWHALADLRTASEHIRTWLSLSKQELLTSMPEATSFIQSGAEPATGWPKIWSTLNTCLAEFWPRHELAHRALTGLPQSIQAALDNLERPGWAQRLRRVLDALAEWPATGGIDEIDSHPLITKLSWSDLPDWNPLFRAMTDAQRDLYSLRTSYAPQQPLQTPPQQPRQTAPPTHVEFDANGESFAENEDAIPAGFRELGLVTGAPLSSTYLAANADWDLRNYELTRNFGPGKPLTKRIKLGRVFVYSYLECLELCQNPESDE